MRNENKSRLKLMYIKTIEFNFSLSLNARNELKCVLMIKKSVNKGQHKISITWSEKTVFSLNNNNIKRTNENSSNLLKVLFFSLSREGLNNKSFSPTADTSY